MAPSSFAVVGITALFVASAILWDMATNDHTPGGGSGYTPSPPMWPMPSNLNSPSFPGFCSGQIYGQFNDTNLYPTIQYVDMINNFTYPNTYVTQCNSNQAPGSGYTMCAYGNGVPMMCDGSCFVDTRIAGHTVQSVQDCLIRTNGSAVFCCDQCYMFDPINAPTPAYVVNSTYFHCGCMDCGQFVTTAPNTGTGVATTTQFIPTTSFTGSIPTRSHALSTVATFACFQPISFHFSDYYGGNTPFGQSVFNNWNDIVEVHFGEQVIPGLYNYLFPYMVNWFAVHLGWSATTVQFTLNQTGLFGADGGQGIYGYIQPQTIAGLYGGMTSGGSSPYLTRQCNYTSYAFTSSGNCDFTFSADIAGTNVGQYQLMTPMGCIQPQNCPFNNPSYEQNSGVTFGQPFSFPYYLPSSLLTTVNPSIVYDYGQAESSCTFNMQSPADAFFQQPFVGTSDACDFTYNPPQHLSTPILNSMTSLMYNTYMPLVANVLNGMVAGTHAVDCLFAATVSNLQNSVNLCHNFVNNTIAQLLLGKDPFGAIFTGCLNTIDATDLYQSGAPLMAMSGLYQMEPTASECSSSISGGYWNPQNGFMSVTETLGVTTVYCQPPTGFKTEIASNVTGGGFTTGFTTVANESTIATYTSATPPSPYPTPAPTASHQLPPSPPPPTQPVPPPTHYIYGPPGSENIIVAPPTFSRIQASMINYARSWFK